ncbi:hypothetical protein LR48_Vigan01g032800 [Vigna angularis]|uniref:Uncharacterized protein n=1 Tax=Phaseolus angularis TaxID=3914 RepID=A0A0L9TJH5_PHAAN|nr:hypothetical protein LR48_Vigan01g032800 [Vigna angularis]
MVSMVTSMVYCLYFSTRDHARAFRLNKGLYSGNEVKASDCVLEVHNLIVLRPSLELTSGLSQVRSEHGSAPTPDDTSNTDDDIPSKGGTLKHQPSSSTSSADEAIQRLTQLLDQRDHENRALREEYSDLRDEFSSFKALVMRALPQTSDTPSIVPPTQPRPSPSPAVPHQPTPVQPTPVQPSTDDQEDEHLSEDYVDF